MAHILTLLTLLTLLSFLLSSTIPDTEYTALLALYDSTNGYSWSWSDPSIYGPIWTFTTPPTNPCFVNNTSWQGITCSHPPSICQLQLCHITSIELQSYNLTGYITPSLNQLTHITSLVLSHNYINGTIPSSLGTLNTLQTLKLSHNLITGTIPTELCGLINMESLKLDDNSLTGYLPSAMSNLTSLRYLFLSRNRLSGTLPLDWWMLPQLMYLQLADNLFTGSIPHEYGRLQTLVEISFSSNYLTGSIPSSIGNLTELAGLYLYVNQLTGSIPSEIAHLTKLQLLWINGNHISGTIPPELGRLSRLSELFPFSNSLTGPIPSELSQLSRLLEMHLYSNELTGTIPPQLSSLSKLVFMYLHNNMLTGPLPSEFGTFDKLKFLLLHSNSLSQTIPPSVANISKLEFLYLHENYFSGTLPSELGEMSRLVDLYLNDNLLSGPIPTPLCRLTQLAELYLDSNALTGSLPENMTDMRILEFLYLNNNMLSGWLPEKLGNLRRLKYLFLQNNRFSGRLPSDIGRLGALEGLKLSYNLFTGKLGSYIGSMSSMRQLYIQHNMFTGSLDTVFIYPLNMSLVNLDFSDNRFSGALPPAIFRFPFLRTVALTRNCFSGTLPKEMCSAQGVIIFAMDGLSSAKFCSVKNLASSLPVAGSVLHDSMSGSIPKCVWTLPNMSVLHLAGNGLEGTIGSIPSYSALINLSLSHNHISGTVPASVQKRIFVDIDLSHNKITGEYKDGVIGSDTSRITLEVNRLSGQLPRRMLSGNNLHILKGNIFGCQNIPEGDRSSDTYSCSSSELDRALAVVACSAGVVLVLIGSMLLSWSLVKYDCRWKTRCGAIYSTLQRFNTRVYDMYSDMKYFNSMDTSSVDIETYPLVNVMLFCQRLRASALDFLFYGILGMLLFTPIYVMKILDNGSADGMITTHSHTYRWLISVAYITGQLPAGLILVSWVCFIVVYVYRVKLRTCDSRADSLRLNGSTETGSISYREYLTIISMMCVNVVVVVLVNGLYIYLTLRDLSPNVHLAVQIALALFKLGYNFIFLPNVVLFPFKKVTHAAWVKLVVLLVNSLLIPGVVTAITSPTCYQGIFVESDEISSMYSYTECSQVVLDPPYGSKCISYSLVSEEVSLIPPFSYNYSCTSTVLTAYIPVYLILYAGQTILPLFIIMVLNSCSLTHIPGTVRRHLPSVMFPELRPVHLDKCSAGDWDKSDVVGKHCVKAQNIITSQAHHTAILFSFGLCSPFLALSILIAVCMNTSQWRFLIGRYISRRIKHTGSHGNRLPESGGSVLIDPLAVTQDLCLSQLNSECIINTTVEVFMWPTVWSSCIFFTLLCWEVAGDAVGWKKSVWVPCVFLSIPVFLWVGTKLHTLSLSDISSYNIHVIGHHIANPLNSDSRLSDRMSRKDIQLPDQSDIEISTRRSPIDKYNCETG